VLVWRKDVTVNVRNCAVATSLSRNSEEKAYHPAEQGVDIGASEEELQGVKRSDMDDSSAHAVVQFAYEGQ
jgi:hypothetical protein